jgi:hypothetical protein
MLRSVPWRKISAKKHELLSIAGTPQTVFSHGRRDVTLRWMFHDFAQNGEFPQAFSKFSHRESLCADQENKAAFPMRIGKCLMQAE